MTDVISTFSSPDPFHSPFWDQIVKSQSLPVGVSLLDRGWDLGLPQGHQRPLEGVLSVEKSGAYTLVNHSSSQHRVRLWLPAQKVSDFLVYKQVK